MRIGVPKETTNQERRVGMTPEGAAALGREGHEVVVEAGAGAGAGFADEQYTGAGARLVDTAAAWDVDLVVKVKEPLPAEYPRLAGQIVFTYFHLAGADPALTEALLQAGTTAIAYETVEDARGRLPLLAPMSGVAGSMAAMVGSHYLAADRGGRGTLVIVDVSIDQGGCVETARPTSHSDPVYTEHGVTHYCVTNMPGAYPRTATQALTAATWPYLRRLAARGTAALDEDPGFAKGLNVEEGRITYHAVAEALERMDAYRDRVH